MEFNKLKKLEPVYKNILYALFTLPALFLLVNRLPILLVASVVIVTLLGIVIFFIKKSITVVHKETIFLLIIIYAYFILSYFFSNQRFLDFISYKFLKNDGNFFFCYILFFVYAIPFLDYKKLANLFFKLVFGTFTLFSILGIFEYFTGKQIMKLPNDIWGSLVRVDPASGKMFFALNFAHNATGSVYALVSVFALIFFLRHNNKRLKALYFFIMLFCMVGLFITKSRGSYLAFLLSVLVILWLNYRSWKKFLIAIGALLLLLVPLLFTTGTYKRLIQIANIGGTNFLRLYYWDKAIVLFSQSPLFGIGFGRFNDVFNIDRHVFKIDRLLGYPQFFSYYGDPIYFFDSANAHNSYIQFLTETGIIGLLLLIVFWILCFVKVFKAYIISKDEFSKKVFLASIASIIVLFVLSLTENFFSSTTLMIPVSMVVSFSIGLYWQTSRNVSMPINI